MTGHKKTTTRTKTALWLLIAPTGLVILTFSLFAVLNLVFNPTMWPTADTAEFASTPLLITIANITLFIMGAVGVTAWLPGLIAGIVLLATTKK